jgi:hypothetical protein
LDGKVANKNMLDFPGLETEREDNFSFSTNVTIGSIICKRFPETRQFCCFRTWWLNEAK